MLLWLFVSLASSSCLIAICSAMLMFDRVESDPEMTCFLAMCDVDSGCVPLGCSTDQFDRLGCGYFRLNIYQYRQCYQPGKRADHDENEAWLRCAENYECSMQCIKIVASRFRTKCYGKSDCEAVARIHDGGANGCRDRKTALYWKKVNDICKGDCRKPFFTRH